MSNTIQFLTENKIRFQLSGKDAITYCPFCSKELPNGERLAEYYIKIDSGDGECYGCGKRATWNEYLEKLGLKTEEPKAIEPVKEPEKPIEVKQVVPIDVSQLKPLKTDDLIKILGLTIKHDELNKAVTFLCELSAYTEGAQFNISYNAPSSAGKSYIPTEIARLFPADDVMEIGYCSPTAFFHDVGEQDKNQKGKIIVNLSRKILIFLDQPHTQLLERLRPLLSHDKKEISVKITDKSQKQGLRTKNVVLIGYPSVIFCTAGLRIDEQEATRFLLLSPEVNQEKIRQGICEAIKKEADNDSYRSWLEENPDRKMLKERILAIRQENIQEIKIESPNLIQEKFFGQANSLKPRHQRDIKRLMAIIKSLALLNLWFRKRDGSTVMASDEDINEAFKIWEKVSVSQELNLPPYIYNLYSEIILPTWKAKGTEEGLTRQEIIKAHYDIYGRMVDSTQLRMQILPMLETTGLITQEQDPNDKRKILICPTGLSITKKPEENNDTKSGGD